VAEGLHLAGARVVVDVEGLLKKRSKLYSLRSAIFTDFTLKQHMTCIFRVFE
jgi:hypothetical protein